MNLANNWQNAAEGKFMSHFMKICALVNTRDPLDLIEDDFNHRMIIMAMSSNFRNLKAINFGSFYDSFIAFLKESEMHYTTHAVLKEGLKTSVRFYPKNITRTMDHIEIDRNGNVSYLCTTAQAMYFYMKTDKRNITADLDRNFGSVAKNIVHGYLKAVPDWNTGLVVTFTFKTTNDDLLIAHTFVLNREKLNESFLNDNGKLSKKYPEMYQLFSG